MNDNMARTWPEAGIIWCEKVQVHCALCNIEDGICMRDTCNVVTREYQKSQEAIRQRRIANHERDRRDKRND